MSFEELQENLVVLKSSSFGTNFLLGISGVDHFSKYNSVSQENTIIENCKKDAYTYKQDLLKFKQDLALLKKSGIQIIRFSLSWSRILPDGIGETNKEAIEFYNEALDICIKNNVVPFVSIFDAKLPINLEKKGGWSNRQMLEWFEHYVSVCAGAFAKKVSQWTIFNDPSLFINPNQFLAINSSGKNGVNNFLSALHHAFLCQSLALKKIKQIEKKSQVGTFFCCNYIIPLTFSEKDLTAVERTDALLNRIFIEPSLGLGYPINVLPFLKSISKYSLPGDDDLIKVDFDFIGLQNCTREIVKHNLFVPYLNAKIVEYNSLRVKNNHLGSEIYQELIYLIIRKYSRYQGVRKIYINEPVTIYNYQNNELHGFPIKKENKMKLIADQIILANQSGGKVNGYFLST